jgi:DNA end-binding protein Ku
MEEVKRASLTTKLKLMGIEAPVSLYKASGEKKREDLETAGPNGGALRAEKVAAEDEAPAERKDTPLPPVPEAAPASAPGRYAQALIEEGSGEVVGPDDVRKGIRLEDGTFVDLTAHLERAAEETALQALEVITFIRREQVPRDRIRQSYYVAAGDGEGFPPAPLLRALMEAMKAAGRVGVVRWTKAQKGQTLGVLVVHASGALEVLELEWAENMRLPNARCLSHLHAEVSVAQVDRTVELITAMSGGRSDLDDLQDARAQIEERVIADARAGKLEGVETVEAPAPDEGMEDLEKVLAASVEEATA